MHRLEIISTTLEDAIAAEAGGAQSVEIIAERSLGGLTPSEALVRAVRAAIKIDINVIIRPHARSFVYTADERKMILTDTETMVNAGATGIVFGALNADSSVDLDFVRQVGKVAAPVRTTLHRAIDECSQPEAALIALQGVVQRVLTSGGAPDVWAGRETIRDWVHKYGEVYTFACGGGVVKETLKDLAYYTHAPEYHTGNAVRTNDRVDPVKVRAFYDLING